MAVTFEYLAGVIDGEGCITLYKKKDKKTKSGFSYSAYLTITSKDKWFLEVIQSNFGGYLNSQGHGAFSNNPIWSLRFNPDEMRRYLPKLIPHLILKQHEAVLLLKGLAITEYHRFRDYDPTGLDEIVMQLKQMKKERNPFNETTGRIAISE